MLERRVLELGLGDHVEFDDRFLSIDELADLLAATDVFVTPYRNREQIASGALTFALAAGCAVVSTPYWYAQDMLGLGRGHARAVRRPARARRRRVRPTSTQPETHLQRRAPRRRGSASSLAWPSVARATAAVLEEAHGIAPRRRPIGVAELQPDEPAARPRADARRRRRDHPARKRDHPEPRERLLRRRRRAARGRLARVRAPRRRAGSGRRSSTGRSRSCSTRQARAGCGTS